jgi:hypothetical protein
MVEMGIVLCNLQHLCDLGMRVGAFGAATNEGKEFLTTDYADITDGKKGRCDQQRPRNKWGDTEVIPPQLKDGRADETLLRQGYGAAGELVPLVAERRRTILIECAIRNGRQHKALSPSLTLPLL